jgi:hypothetical protein
MTLELISVAISGTLAVAAFGILALARRHIHPLHLSGTVEIVPRESGDRIRVVKSRHGVVTSIEIPYPSADVRDILDV